ncbi:hypothetical protein F5Y06DRAFT_294920 [Hypoxylon sp. FL0890]|nr:hypothetical protein F5Y06DRAFT_294920 [Hypoxylon sp. FL0890]
MNTDIWHSLTPTEQKTSLDGSSIGPSPAVQSNLFELPSRNDPAIGITTTCMILATTFVFTRAYSRLFVEKKARLQDILVLAAFGSYIGAAWTILRALSLGGFFIHQLDITAREFESVAFAFFMLPQFYTVTILFSNTATLL